jgi:hypothetical protein
MFNTLFSLTTLYFFLISLINVILSSTKSICTVRYGRGINVLTNVVAYSFYTVVVKQTASLPLEITVIATAVANALGVWLSYVILDLIQRDRLWKIEVVVPKHCTAVIHGTLAYLPHDYIEVGPKTLFNFYCSSKKETKEVIEQCKKYHGRFFAVENKYRGFEQN